MMRIDAALSARGAAQLLRPLTIARFVELTADLLSKLQSDPKLTIDNYVSRLPLLMKRYLYPGTLSKSWLKTVNTLHSFPQALALIGYLLDLSTRVTTPISEDILYLEKNDLACLRHEFLHKCLIRFEEPDPRFDNLDEEYLKNLKAHLGINENQIIELEKIIKEYSLCLENEEQSVSRENERRCIVRRDELSAALRNARTALADLNARAARVASDRDALAHLPRALDHEVDRASAEIQEVKRELESQTMTLAERTRLLDEIDYAHRVLDSKEALADQINKMVQSKEIELSLAQKRTLDSCMAYNQQIIHLSGDLPQISGLAIDEKELMEASCVTRAQAHVEQLRALHRSLVEQKSARDRAKHTKDRLRARAKEELRAAIAQEKLAVEQAQRALDEEMKLEQTRATTAQLELEQLTAKTQALQNNQELYEKTHAQLAKLKQEDQEWKTNLNKMQEYLEAQKSKMNVVLERAYKKRLDFVQAEVKKWTDKLEKK